MRFGSLRFGWALAAAATLVLVPTRARAEDPRPASEPRDAAAAEALFEEAKALLEKGDYVAACPKFDESYRLDPATGGLYALALCHEQSGKLATAWVEFIEVAGRAHSEHNADREAAARERADSLLPRLSFLVIRVDPATAGLPGLSVNYDGVLLRPAAYGTALPVDTGHHVVRAEAPDRQPWETAIDIGTQPERRTLTVPALGVSTAAAGAAAVATPPTARVVPPARRRGTVEVTPLRVGAVALGGAGVASLTVGGFALWRALEKKASSNGGCDATGCTVAAENDRVAAHEAATWATVGAVSGLALLGAGAVLYLVGKPPSAIPEPGETSLLVERGQVALRHAF